MLRAALPQSKPIRIACNIALYQVGWFICILQGGATALVATVLLICLHFHLMVDTDRIKTELRFITQLFFVGLIIETIAINAGALVPNIQQDPLAFVSWLPPLWLLCLWVLFATTLSHGLAWLSNRPFLAAALAVLSAPSSYLAGAYLSPYMSLGDSTTYSLIVIGVLWAIGFPLVMRFLVKV